MSGLDSFTVSYWAKTTPAAASKWEFFAGPRVGGGMDAEVLVPIYEHERYIGILETETTVNAEYYNCEYSDFQRRYTWMVNTVTKFGREPEWHHVAFSFNSKTNRLKFYFNGVLQWNMEVTDANHTMHDILGDNSVVFIGYAPWESGEYFTGQLDEYRIYGRALIDTEVIRLADQSQI